MVCVSVHVSKKKRGKWCRGENRERERDENSAGTEVPAGGNMFNVLSR